METSDRDEISFPCFGYLDILTLNFSICYLPTFSREVLSMPTQLRNTNSKLKFKKMLNIVSHILDLWCNYGNITKM